jgi:serine/threonine-protein kinase
MTSMRDPPRLIAEDSEVPETLRRALRVARAQPKRGNLDLTALHLAMGSSQANHPAEPVFRTSRDRPPPVSGFFATRSRPRRMAMAAAKGAALLAAAAALTWGVVRLSPHRLTSAANDPLSERVSLRQRLNDAWDENRRLAMRRAFFATGEPYAANASMAVERAFDDYAKAWESALGDRRGTSKIVNASASQRDLRTSCLLNLLTELRTLGDLYVAADSKLVEQAVQSAQSLPALASCTVPAVLREEIGLPSDPQARTLVEELESDVARAAAFELAGRYEKGMTLAHDALTRATALHASAVEARAALILAELQEGHGDWVESSGSFQRAYDAAVAAPNDEIAARAAVGLMRTIGVRQGRFAEGDYWAHAAGATIERLERRDELVALYDSNRSMLTLGEGKYDEALTLAKHVVEFQEREHGSSDYRTAEAFNNLGRVERKMARYEEALQSYQRALAVNEAVFGPAHPVVGATLIGLGAVHGESGEHEPALAAYERALHIFERVNPDHLYLEAIYNNKACQLQAVGRLDEAFDLSKRALEMFEKKLGMSSYRVVVPLNTLGSIEIDRNHPKEALAYFERSLRIGERERKPGNDCSDRPLCGMGEAKRRLGRLDDALADFQRSLAVTEKALGPNHPQLVPALLGMGRAYIGRHQESTAMAALERAQAIRESLPGDGVELADIRFALAQAIWKVGDRLRAVDLATRARAAYEAAAGVRRAELHEVEAWLVRHQAN